MDSILPRVPKDQAAGQIGSLIKGIAILDYVVVNDRGVRAQDVADHFALDRSTAYRFLMTLEGLELLSKDSKTKLYSLGPRFLSWQGKRGQSHWLVDLVRPEIEGLARYTGQTAHLAVLQAGEIELLEVAPSGAVIAVPQNPGDREPLYNTAVGKAILAFLPVREQHGLMQQIEFRRLTDTTLCSIEELERELLVARRDGVAFDDGEGMPDVTCIATPLFDSRGYPLASVGISAVRGFFPGSIRQQSLWIDAVKKSGQRLTETIGRLAPAQAQAEPPAAGGLAEAPSRPQARRG